MTDLETVDPTGRLDVVLYKLLGIGARYVEQQHGLEGTWDVLKPHASTLINKYVGGVELPTEAELVLKLMMLGQQQKQREG